MYVRAVYAVFFKLEAGKVLEVGALGEIDFPAGTYVYVGSAMNGVEARIKRHFSGDKRKHWHVDYFAEAAEPFDYFILPDTAEYECVLADAVSGFAEPVKGFGCSDCDCDAHLFRIYNSGP